MTLAELVKAEREESLENRLRALFNRSANVEDMLPHDNKAYLALVSGVQRLLDDCKAGGGKR